MASSVEDVVRKIDWNQLAEQKAWLVKLSDKHPEAAGLLGLLDALQDAAVDSMGLPEKDVFPQLEAGG